MVDGYDYAGSDIRSSAASSADHCATLCAEDTDCKFWTYNRVQRHCYLKYSDAGKTAKSSDVSGNKACGGTTGIYHFLPPFGLHHYSARPRNSTQTFELWGSLD
jgi:hypothetical protein